MFYRQLLLGLVASGGCYGQEARVSFLYWKTQVNGLSSAVAPHGNVTSPAFRWGPGIQVGWGTQIPHDTWKIDLQLTLYRTHTTTSVHGQLLPVWTLPTEGGICTQVDQHYRLHLGIVDMFLSKPLALTRSLHLSPYCGISYFSVRQKYHLEYFHPEDSNIWRMKNKFWGVGPAMGCSAAFVLGKGWSLVGNGSIKLPCGQFYTHQGERVKVGKQLRLFDTFAALSPVATGALGVRWQAKHWSVEFGVDQLLFFAQNQLPHLVGSGSVVSGNGDLSIQGIHLSAACQF